MYIAFALAALFSAATCVSVDRFTGQWLPMVTFPNVVTNQICDKYNLSVVETDPCECGNLSATIFKIEKGVTDTPARSVTMPVILVENIQEVEPALLVRCECGGEYVRHALFRAVGDNYYVMYEKLPQNVYGPEEPNTANLLVKKAPTSSELREVLASIPDLKHRSTGIMCDPDKNVGL